MVDARSENTAEKQRAYLVLAEDSKTLRFMAREAFYKQRFLGEPTDDGHTVLDKIASRVKDGMEGDFPKLGEKREDSPAIGVLEDHIRDVALCNGSTDTDLKKHLGGRIEGRKSAIVRLELPIINFDAAESVLNAVVNLLAPPFSPTLPRQAKS
jgi:hypothetical protein